ncbi:hypothetical protein [Mannheimia indoligenes]|uniref:Lipoprotein n=1 Tax=Mannheimia indoligenes TaxID=3103145 RepID=A0ABU7ZGG6_9PAST
MKKILQLSVIISGMLLSACGNEDIIVDMPKLESFEFYIKNPERMDELSSSYCEETYFDKYDSVLRSDKVKNENIVKFVNANFDNVINNSVSCELLSGKIAEYKRQQEKQKREKEEQEKQEILDKVVKEEINKYSNLSWDKAISKIISTNKEFKLWSLKHLLQQFQDNRPSGNTPEKLTYYSYVYFVKQGYDTLMALSVDDLVKEPEYCKLDKRENSACGVWNQTLKLKFEELKFTYMADWEKLKESYNQYCYQPFDDFLVSKNAKNPDEITRSTYAEIEEKSFELMNNMYCGPTVAAIKELGLTVNLYKKLD